MRGEVCEVIVYSQFVSAVLSLFCAGSFIFMLRISIFLEGMESLSCDCTCVYGDGIIVSTYCGECFWVQYCRWIFFFANSNTHPSCLRCITEEHVRRGIHAADSLKGRHSFHS